MRKISILLLALALTMLVSACGQKTDLPEWLPEESGDWQVRRFSLHGGKDQVGAASINMLTPEQEAVKYGYSTVYGLQEEGRSKDKYWLTAEEVAQFNEALTDFLKELYTPERMGSDFYYSVTYDTNTLIDGSLSLIDARLVLNAGGRDWWYVYSVSQKKFIKVQDAFGNEFDAMAEALDKGQHRGWMTVSTSYTDQPMTVFVLE